jgi:hypothetical protein
VLTTTGPQGGHEARGTLVGVLNGLKALGLVGFAKGEKLPDNLPDGTLHGSEYACGVESDDYMRRWLHGSLRWSVSSSDEAGLTRPYQLCLRQGPKVRKDGFSVRRLIFFAFELFRNAESAFGGSDDSGEFIVGNSIERIGLDLQLLRKNGGDDLQVDFRARLADLLDDRTPFSTQSA